MKKKQCRQRRTYLRTAGSWNDASCGISDSTPEMLHLRARHFLRSAQTYRLAGMAAAARVQWHNATCVYDEMENQTQAAYCREQKKKKKKIRLYDFEKEEE